jgi:hypothetical protein
MGAQLAGSVLCIRESLSGDPHPHQKSPTSVDYRQGLKLVVQSGCIKNCQLGAFAVDNGSGGFQLTFQSTPFYSVGCEASKPSLSLSFFFFISASVRPPLYKQFIAYSQALA